MLRAKFRPYKSFVPDDKAAFIPRALGENRRLMQEVPPGALTPFVFSDPAGKRWPRLRRILLLFGVLVFLGTVLFVQTLFVAPQMRVPFSLRQLKRSEERRVGKECRSRVV